MTESNAPESIERRLLVASSWLAMVFSAIGVFSNHLLGGEGILVWACAVCALAFGALGWWALRGAPTAQLAYGFLAVAGFLIAATWDANGGVRGSTTIAVSAAIVFAVLALPSRHAARVIVCVLLFFLLLVGLEIWDGVPSPSPFVGMADAIDSTVTTLCIATLSGAGVAVMRRVYEDNLASLTAANRQIEELAARALAADREKTQFLARMSHDLRTPLAAVMGSLEVAAREPGRADLPSLIEGARRRCVDLERIVADLLNLGLVELGEMRRSDSDVELAELVAAIADTARPQVGVRFEYGLDPNLPTWVRLDVTRATQAISNLLSNACKHTDAGSIELRVDGAEGWLRFAVRDTGPGIEACDQPLLGEPFMQLPQGRQRGGTGLGLFIAKRIAALLDGRYSLHSTPGVGTLALFEVPLVEGHAQPQSTPPAAKPAPLHVLVADDEPILRQILEAMLHSVGHSAELVEDGAAALARAQAREFDVVLLDVQMPVMDGLEAARRLRAIRPELPLVALSANAYAADIQAGLAAGMDAFLTKPVSLAALCQTLQQARDARRGQLA